MSSAMILTLNLIDDSILLNKGILDALDWPRQVQVMVNRDAKMLLVRACSIEDEQALVMPAEDVQQFEISARSFLKGIRHVLGWEDDQPRMCYGEYLPAHQAVRFNLEAAVPLEMEQL